MKSIKCRHQSVNKFGSWRREEAVARKATGLGPGVVEGWREEGN